jgi:hypothetical protein
MRRLMLRHFGPALPEIESILGRPSPDPKVRDALAAMLWQYIHDTATAGREPSKEVDRRIEQVDRLARSLRDALHALVYAPDNDRSAGTALFMIGSDAAMEMLNLLDEFSLATWQRLKSRGGQPADADLHVLMWRMMVLYESTTGKLPSVTTDPEATKDTDPAEVRNAYSGQLMEIATLVDRVAAERTNRPPKSNGALGQMLKEMRAAMKRWPEEQAERERETQYKRDEILRAIGVARRRRLEAAGKFAAEKRRRHGKSERGC